MVRRPASQREQQRLADEMFLDACLEEIADGHAVTVVVPTKRAAAAYQRAASRRGMAIQVQVGNPAEYVGAHRPLTNGVAPLTIETAQVGDRVRFAGDRMPYTVQARDARFVVCTRPFALKKTVLYTVVDLVEKVRGADNYYSLGYETPAQCRRALGRFRASVRWVRMQERKHPGVIFDRPVQVSHRNQVPLEVAQLRRPRCSR